MADPYGSLSPLLGIRIAVDCLVPGKTASRSSRTTVANRQDPAATARSFRGGWFYPIEVENVFLFHPNVAEAAVFGWPHERYSEVAIAAAVTRAPVSDEDLVAFSRSQLADYKIPGTIPFVPRMPRDPMGKILKSKLKDRLRQELVKRP